jgi:hypothetical protein
MFEELRIRWTARQRRRAMRQLRENMAYFGFSLSQYSDEQLLDSVKKVGQGLQTSCTTASEAAFIYQQIAAGGDEAREQGYLGANK